ncbi:neuronal acetylcholine receptor subunit alpha-3-like [Ylistrum balloti]|uniref:neuronal acetylcholine receptor subunit alpha-3-like n=1 Tax=Ylistrum balloti TaxID=509963 RepID=UPI002905AE28|nr:neuronal acetylcholine receptor subunit alpha-3-like [Ylistrum balloti]
MNSITLVIWMCVCLSQGRLSKTKLPEARLHDDILGINKYVRPVSDITKPVNVRLRLFLLSIIELNERKGTMSSSIWLDLRWFDEQLAWNTSKYSGLETSRVPFTSIWTPDILLRNEIGNKKGMKHTNFVDPTVRYTGEVIWWPGKEINTKCKIDTTKYPFDEQVCTLCVGKWYSDDSKVNITTTSSKINIMYYEESEEWELLDTSVELDTRLEALLEFSINLFRVKIKRRSAFFMMNIVLPVLLMSFLNQLCFVLPLESGEKIGMCMAIFLTFAVFLSLVGNSLPQSSVHMPAYCVYLVFQTILGILTISSEVFILRVYNNSCWDDSTLRRFAFTVAPCLGIPLANNIKSTEEDNVDLPTCKSKGYGEEICRKVAIKLDIVCGWVMLACNLAFTTGFFFFVNT